jgi:hypothetical protein
MTDRENPYRSPHEANTLASASGNLDENPLPERVVKEINNLIRDARLAVLVGLIPILGLPFLWRLVQWYLLKSRYPMLISRKPGVHEKLARDFRSSIGRLWFAVLLWPIVFVICYIYMKV